MPTQSIFCSKMGKKGLGVGTGRLSMKTTKMLDYDGINGFMFRSQSGLASAFLLRVPRTAPASLRVLSSSSWTAGGRLDRILRKMGEASLRSSTYAGSYDKPPITGGPPVSSTHEEQSSQRGRNNLASR